jgi:hypothetical protein
MLREDLWLVFDLSSLFLLQHMGLEPAVQATISPIDFMSYILQCIFDCRRPTHICLEVSHSLYCRFMFSVELNNTHTNLFFLIAYLAAGWNQHIDTGFQNKCLFGII